MGNVRKLPNDELQVIVDAVAEHGSQRKAAKALGMAQSSLNYHMKAASARGLNGYAPVMPGFEVSQVSSNEKGDRWIKQRPESGDEFELPAGHSIKGVSALVDQDGNLRAKWIKTRNEYTATDALADIKAAYDAGEFDYIKRPSIPASDFTPATDPHKLTLLPLADLHIGLFAWGQEAAVNWDLKIAESRIGATIDDVISRSPPSGRAIVLGGGDLLHSDNNENKTAKSGNVLQVDGRYQKVLTTACRLLVRAVDGNLARHGEVVVRILPGNHDEHASVAVAYFLLAWYRDEPRVTVDVDPSMFFWHRFGKTFIGATHGHMVKLKDMAMIMAHRRAADWGATLFRYCHGFHIHHYSKYATEGDGVISESHQTPTPADAWHFASGYLSGRSMQSITYDDRFGEISRVRTAMIDA